MQDREAVAAEAIARLETALMTGLDVAGGVRWSFYRNPAFCVALFVVASQTWFGADRDIREITSFVARIRADRPADALGFPGMEAEALIRIARGEMYFADDLDPDELIYLEIAVAVLAAMFAEWQPDGLAVGRLLEKASMIVPVLLANPLVGSVLEDWYRFGVHDLPTASLDAPVDRADEPDPP